MIQTKTKTIKKTPKTYPILSEEGDLADALNETARMRASGKAPKSSTGGMKVMDKFQKEGKLGPAVPKKKMGGKVMKKAQSGGKFPDFSKDGKITQKDVLMAKGVIPKKAKSGAKMKKAMMGTGMSPAPMMMKKGGSMKKCKYGCK